MNSRFASLDWLVIVVYGLVMVVVSMRLSRRDSDDARDYFLAGGSVPPWLAAISVLATTQSAATFLGGPDYGYRGDLTYLGTTFGSLLAAFLVARYFMPRFYAQGVTTVYELLAVRFGIAATRAAGAMFLIGRILAGGARLYLAAIALSMIIFLDIGADHIILSAALLVAASFAMTFHGGLRAIVWIDLLQFIVYVGAALSLLALLLSIIPLSLADIVHSLAATPDGTDKLRVFNLALDFSQPFSVPAIMTGYALLMVGNMALDQDTTQRLLACKDAKAGARGIYLSVLASCPVVATFIVIGLLLYIVYQRPELMSTGGAGIAEQRYQGANVSVFMHFMLTRTPPGLRGLAAIGVVATTIGTTMSALNAMSSVLIEDFYRPWRSRTASLAEAHFVRAGRVGMALTGLATLAMAVLSLAWQRYSDKPLLEFVLSVMNFAYAGLLGVYFTAIFTKRGSTVSVMAALAVGFVVIVILQPGVADWLMLPDPWRRLAFPWQLCAGFLAAFCTCAAAPLSGQRAVALPERR